MRPDTLEEWLAGCKSQDLVHYMLLSRRRNSACIMRTVNTKAKCPKVIQKVIPSCHVLPYSQQHTPVAAKKTKRIGVADRADRRGRAGGCQATTAAFSDLPWRCDWARLGLPNNNNIDPIWQHHQRDIPCRSLSLSPTFVLFTQSLIHVLSPYVSISRLKNSQQ